MISKEASGSKLEVFLNCFLVSNGNWSFCNEIYVLCALIDLYDFSEFSESICDIAKLLEQESLMVDAGTFEGQDW